jgi:hypothetical protein
MTRNPEDRPSATTMLQHGFIRASAQSNQNCWIISNPPSRETSNSNRYPHSQNGKRGMNYNTHTQNGTQSLPQTPKRVGRSLNTVVDTNAFQNSFMTAINLYDQNNYTVKNNGVGAKYSGVGGPVIEIRLQLESEVGIPFFFFFQHNVIRSDSP